jgi:hypothetical protein
MQMKIKTIGDAAAFVKAVHVCTVFPSEKTPHTSLYEHVDLPEKQPGETGWGQRVKAVWAWKNQLPAQFPDEIFYGKIKGGFAVLMDMAHLEQVHFAAAYKPVGQLNALAQQTYERIRLEPWSTTDLRREMIEETGCSKSRFDTALKNLQISMNVVRDSDAEQDTWLTFQEVHAEIWSVHVPEDD